jgi:hypothetical protein
MKTLGKIIIGFVLTVVLLYFCSSCITPSKYYCRQVVTRDSVYYDRITVYIYPDQTVLKYENGLTLYFINKGDSVYNEELNNTYKLIVSDTSMIFHGKKLIYLDCKTIK